MRERDFGEPWSGRGSRLRAENATRVVDLVSVASEVLDFRLERPGDVEDCTFARDTLRTVWNAALDSVAGPEPGAMREAPSAETIELLRMVKDLDEQILSEQIESRDQAFRRVREALWMLREADSSAALVELAGAAVCRIGFDRVIVSRIVDSLWLPETVFVSRDHRWADEILEIGRAQPQVLDGGLVDSEIVRRRTGILVDQVQERTGVNRPIAEASISRSYVAAPVFISGEVVGFVHADRYYQQRNVDETDRSVLAMFTEGFSHALSRVMALGRMVALRAEIDSIGRNLTAACDHNSRTAWGGARRAEAVAGIGQVSVGRPGRPRRRPAAWYPSLTRRELEVLSLMANGDTNARIARRLVVSEGTVKSHVKNILRKLGAANRAEAVSKWLQEGNSPAGTPMRRPVVPAQQGESGEQPGW